MDQSAEVHEVVARIMEEVVKAIMNKKCNTAVLTEEEDAEEGF